MRLKQFIERLSKTSGWYLAEGSSKLRRKNPAGDCPQCPVAAVAFDMGYRMWRNRGFYRSARRLRLETGLALAMAADNIVESETHASENLRQLRQILIQSVNFQPAGPVAYPTWRQIQAMSPDERKQLKAIPAQ